MKTKLVDTKVELEQILSIQKANHYDNLSDADKKSKGFVTVKHDFETLQRMNIQRPHVIAVDEGNVVAYALVMLKEFQDFVPLLIPMFKSFQKIYYNQQVLSELNYYVMGQICVSDGYKGKGILKKLYEKHKEAYSKQFDYCITEVSSSNIPSMHAHQKVGFKIISTFSDATDEWNILLWDWT